MNLANYYWYFDKAFSDEFCDHVIRFCSQKETDKGAVDSVLIGKQTKEDMVKKTRNSDIAWVEEKWMYEEIFPFITVANRSAGWNFKIGWTEPFQYTKYGTGQFYDWHCDSDIKAKEEGPGKGLIRKVSASILLNDASEYEGGDFMFDFRNKTDGANNIVKAPIKQKGALLVFPSFVWHKVTPVTSGVRQSLVMWNQGPPYV